MKNVALLATLLAKDTSQWEEHVVAVKRGQLYLNEKALPDRGLR